MVESPSITVPIPTEHRQRTIYDQLDRHQHRRLQNLPTVSVLAGPPAAGGDVWTRWNEKVGRESVTWSHYCTGSSFETWLATLLSATDIRQNSLAYLSTQTGVTANEIESWLRHGSDYQREQYYQRFLTAEDGNELANIIRWSLNYIAGDRDILASDAVGLAAQFGADKPFGEYRLFAAVTRIVPIETLPGLLLAIPQELTPKRNNNIELPLLEVAAKIAELAARLPVAVSIEKAVLEAYLSDHSETRSKAIIREGVIQIDKPRAREIVDWLAKQGLGDRPDPRSLAETLAIYGATPVLLHDAVSLTRKLQSSSTDADCGVARSQAELFLFRLLESIPEFTGLFRLNARLDIRFGNRPMEVDLLAESVGVVVEIDGFYHFQDPENYRRDRRKDLALQRNGYLVIRFLAEDIVSHLEGILETLRSAIHHRWKATNQREV